MTCKPFMSAWGRRGWTAIALLLALPGGTFTASAQAGGSTKDRTFVVRWDFDRNGTIDAESLVQVADGSVAKMDGFALSLPEMGDEVLILGSGFGRFALFQNVKRSGMELVFRVTNNNPAGIRFARVFIEINGAAGGDATAEATVLLYNNARAFAKFGQPVLQSLCRNEVIEAEFKF